MEQLFKKTSGIIALSTVLFGVSACTLTGNGTIDNDGDSRRVGNVVWNNQVDTDVNTLLENQVATDKARLVLIRKNDNNSEQTSANIAVNNRFQVSLQGGNYTMVDSCVGANQLSAHATGFKNNNLLAEENTYQLTGGQTYFFYIKMDETGQNTLEQIPSNEALPILANKRYQSHQISRVVANCASPIVTVAADIVTPTAVLSEKVTIDLEVLFETDQSFVRPEYYTKIVELVGFMEQYPNTEVTIKGYTDSRGSDSYNQALSQRRVDAVKEVLVSQFGVSAERLIAVGYGESMPIASNDTAEGQRLNRRVVAEIEERALSQ